MVGLLGYGTVYQIHATCPLLRIPASAVMSGHPFAKAVAAMMRSAGSPGNGSTKRVECSAITASIGMTLYIPLSSVRASRKGRCTGMRPLATPKASSQSVMSEIATSVPFRRHCLIVDNAFADSFCWSVLSQTTICVSTTIKLWPSTRKKERLEKHQGHHMDRSYPCGRWPGDRSSPQQE